VDHVLYIPTHLGRLLGEDALGILAAIHDVRGHDQYQFHLFLVGGAVAEHPADAGQVTQTGNLVGVDIDRIGDHAAQDDGLAVVGHRGRLQVLNIEDRAGLSVAQADLLGIDRGYFRNDAHDHLPIQSNLRGDLENDTDRLPNDVAGDDAGGGDAAARVEGH